MRILLLTLLLIFNVHIEAENPEKQSDEDVLRNIKTKLWPKAYRTQDTELLSQILHPKFQMIDGNGQISTRKQELKAVETTPWNPQNFTYHIERLEIFNGDTAVVSGRGETDTYTYRSSNVLIKESGSWQAIASHVSGFKLKSE